MITVQEADRLIAAHLPVLPAESVPVASAVGRVLRETIVADRDQPPFDRAMMDGIAIAADDAGPYRIVGESAAGEPAGCIGNQGECVEIMTGAPMPAGADCVIPVESIARNGESVTAGEDATRAPGRFVHPRASDHAAGTELLAPGIILGGPEIAVAVSAGRARLDVTANPAVTVCATGDELVDVDAAVAPHQIRRSNDYAIAAMIEGWGVRGCRRRHVGDDVHAQTEVFGTALEEADVVVLTGGVSMGRHDHVSEVLHALDVTLVFHRVSQKPGRPMWFGVGRKGQPVFALPGNPVSALVSLRRYVKPALERMLGMPAPLDSARAALAHAHRFEPALTCFLPATCEYDGRGRLCATPRAVNTSGDFTALAGTHGFIELALDQVEFERGHSAAWYAW